MGYRPHRASIAERILLTKRKMEEIKEAPVYPTTNVPQTAASNTTTVFQHGALKLTTGLPRKQSSVASVPSTTPVIVSPPSGASSVKAASISSIVSLPSIGSENIKVEKATIGQANKSAIHTATTSNPNTVQSSGQIGKSQDKKAPTIQPVTVNSVMRYQSPPGASFVQQQSVFSNHNAIAKDVQQVLHRPVNHPTWTLPSTEYMHSRLDCQLCKVSITDAESLLVCDACERGIHLKCLQHYGSNGLPKTEWYCPSCVACSKGKPLPPKYGKVTRTVVAPKVSLASGGTSQRDSENPTTKDNSQEVAANGTVIHKNSSEAEIVHNSDRLASGSSKEQSVSASGPQKENVEHAENSSKQKAGHVPPCSGIVTDAVTSSNEFQCGGASTNLQQSHMQSKSTELPSCAVNSENGSMLESSAISVVKNFDHSFSVSSEEKHGIERNSELHLCNDVETASSSRRPAHLTHQADGAADKRIGKPQDVQTMENNAISEHSNVHQLTSNGDMCPKNEIVMGGAKDETIVVDWVGDPLKVVDNKTYYYSCNIDGIAYNLGDHVLIASKDRESAPSKLQSLWEEHDSRSKLAMVNPYFFASDIPELITKPCTAEENEVFASYNQRAVTVSVICGPCEVLHVDKFREETKRNQVVSSELHPIFFCRWKYDESTSSFSTVDT